MFENLGSNFCPILVLNFSTIHPRTGQDDLYRWRYYVSHAPGEWMKRYSYITHLRHFHKICHKCMTGESPTSRTLIYWKTGSPACCLLWEQWTREVVMRKSIAVTSYNSRVMFSWQIFFHFVLLYEFCCRSGRDLAPFNGTKPRQVHQHGFCVGTTLTK